MNVYGTISRRVLLNYRADPAVVRKLVPPIFELDCYGGYAMVGVCFLSIKKVNIFPFPFGHNSDNAAHRIAVIYNGKHGVYIPRRDTGSTINSFIGGRIFPGEHHHSQFNIEDSVREIKIRISNKKVGIANVNALEGEFDSNSIFKKLEIASLFYRNGSVGYSRSIDGARLDGLELVPNCWNAVGATRMSCSSYYYNDASLFPPSSIEFDNILVMRNIIHYWKPLPSISVS